MRISDWRSDVCSSDLGAGAEAQPPAGRLDADGVPEPLRHPEPEPQRGVAARPGDPQVRRRDQRRKDRAAGDGTARPGEAAARVRKTAAAPADRTRNRLTYSHQFGTRMPSSA